MLASKYIYLIQAHENPAQIARLIKSLADSQTVFYIHVDIKSDLAQFEFLREHGQVEFTDERVDCIWGDFSQIEATLCLVKKALSNHTTGMCSLISGSHYPIKSCKTIQHFLDVNYDTYFLECCDAKKLWPKFSLRTDYYKINYSSRRNDYVLLKGLQLTTVSQFVKGNISVSELFKTSFVKRVPPQNMRFYGGSQWWSMSMEHLALIQAFIETYRDELFSYFEYSLCADEFFFQSIVKHIVDDNSAHFSDSTTYVSWDHSKCKTPITFRSDLQELMQQDAHKLFARKFDTTVDATILDDIDKIIQEQ
jgi:hypothetical protein